MIRNKNFRQLNSVLLLSVMLLFAGVGTAQAKIDGLVGATQPSANVFNFTAKAAHISTGEGNTVMIWGYGDDDGHQGSPNMNGQAQYPGPTIIINAGDTITINLTNNLPQATSIIFPGADQVLATGNSMGTLTQEAVFANGTAQYVVTYNQPGTYTYYSGTNIDLQVEMGLVGAIVVRPETPNQAYDTADTAYNYETLFLMTDMDPVIHDQVEFGRFDQIDMSKRYAVYWFLNGRNGPDTLLDSFVSWLPTQPYNCMPRIKPCERILLRMIGGGRDGHPLHTHGNNIVVVGKDARLLSTDGTSADLAFSDYTQSVYPGETYDAIFTWTGANMGWDYYGHAPGDPMTACEQQVEADLGPGTSSHGLPIPVELPPLAALTFSPFYSGSPYLGGGAFLPPGEGGFNQNGGFYYMWHSHNEKELTNWDIFPGGMMTFLIVEPPDEVADPPVVIE